MVKSFTNRFQIIVCIIVLILFTSKSFAQPKFLEPELDINAGLNSNAILVIKKDNLHHIWLGTEHGLSIFPIKK